MTDETSGKGSADHEAKYPLFHYCHYTAGFSFLYPFKFSVHLDVYSWCSVYLPIGNTGQCADHISSNRSNLFDMQLDLSDKG